MELHPWPSRRQKHKKAVVRVIDDEEVDETVRLSSDLFTELFEGCESGHISVCSVVEIALSATPRWMLYPCREDKDLQPSTCSVHGSAAGLLLDRTMAYIHSANPIPLATVVVAVLADAYDTLKTSDIARYFHDCQVLRRGQVLRGLQCKVKSCDPVDQGTVVVGTTKITFVKDDTLKMQVEEDEDTKDMRMFLDTPANWDSSLNGLVASDASIDINVAPLSRKVPKDILIPTGKDYEDDEARGFVSVETLVQIGCFSGDWVNIESIGRPIRLYSFPHPAFFEVSKLYIPPVLYYNLGSPQSLKITPKYTTPPRAREITISRVASDLSTDRMLLPTCLRLLRAHFERHKRIVAQNDLLAIPVDVSLARIAYDTKSDDEDAYATAPADPSAVAWFKVTAVASEDGNEGASVVVVDSARTRVVQSGSCAELLPSTNIPWREYCGIPPLARVISPTSTRLKQLLAVCTSPAGASLQTAILLHSAKRGVGKSVMLHYVAGLVGVLVFEIEACDLVGDTDVKTLGTLKARLERASECVPCVVYIKHIDGIARKAENGGRAGDKVFEIIKEYARPGLVVVASVVNVDGLADAVRAGFNFELELGTPAESERRAVFEYLTTQSRLAAIPSTEADPVLPNTFELAGSVSLDSLALQSAGLTPPDLLAIVKSACGFALDRISEMAQPSDVILGGGGYLKLTADDFEKATTDARRQYSDSIGAPRIPSVKWEDVGGLGEVKSEILDTIEMPLKFPELFSGGVKKRSGILFYGPPGTGKTLLAKAIATTFSLNFFSVKGPELLNMYIGESESNVRKVFQRARDARPCVVFFDELDSVAPKRGNQGDSGGVMDRIVSQLLAELDGMSSGGEGVFVVGATNRPDLLDEALLRPGRFDKMLYLGVSDTHEKQYTILTALTRKFRLSDEVDLRAVAETCPFTYTGADFYALCSDAMLNAMTRLAASIDKRVGSYDPPVSTRWWFENKATKEDIEVVVRQEDFAKARKELVASVSEDELRHYMSVRESFEGAKNVNGDRKGKGKAV